MTETEEFAELNRLVSGELSDAESLALMKRMLRDEDLRRQYERLADVDEALREAYLGAAVEPASGEAPATTADADLPSPERRREQIDAILSRIGGRKRLRLRRPRGETFGWSSGRAAAMPWAVAAALAVVCGILAYISFSDRGAGEPVVLPLDASRAAYYADFRKHLGDGTVGVIWNSEGVSEGGNLAAASTPATSEVIVRVTVDRRNGDETERWTADALMRRDHVLDLVTDGKRAWPVSVQVSVKAGNKGLIPVSVEARLTRDPPVEISNPRLVLTPKEPTEVGSVTSDGYTYKLSIEAVPAGAATGAM